LPTASNRNEQFGSPAYNAPADADKKFQESRPINLPPFPVLAPSAPAGF